MDRDDTLQTSLSSSPIRLLRSCIHQRDGSIYPLAICGTSMRGKWPDFSMVGYGDTYGKFTTPRRNLTIILVTMDASPSHHGIFQSHFRSGTIHPANNNMHISNFKSQAYPASASPAILIEKIIFATTYTPSIPVRSLRVLNKSYFGQSPPS